MSTQGMDSLEGKAGLGEGQEVKAEEGALGALKYMLLLCKSGWEPSRFREGAAGLSGW